MSGLQQEIEQLKGRIQYLDEHTSYSTMTLSMYEAGTPAATTTSGSWGFAQALNDALHNFVGSINFSGRLVRRRAAGAGAAGLGDWLGYRIVRASLRKRGGDPGTREPTTGRLTPG